MTSAPLSLPWFQSRERGSAGDAGYSIVELMVALVITMLAVAAIFTPFTAQYAGYNRQSEVQKLQETAQSSLLMVQRDLMMAGYGVDKRLAFSVEDGGTGRSDRLIVNDATFIDETELLQGIYGQAPIVSNAESSITLDSLNIDRVLPISDKCYDDDGDGECDNANEFAGGGWQYVITDSDDATRKSARILSDDTINSLTLERAVAGSAAAPALYYCVDQDGTDNRCNPTGDGLTQVLRRSDRLSRDLRALAGGIVDLQIAYRDTSNTWYCDGIGSCPAAPFDPHTIALLRVTLVTGSKAMRDQVKGLPVQAENGAAWSDDSHVYRTYTTLIRPRNTSF